MAQVVVGPNYDPTVHEFATNAEAYRQAAEWQALGQRAYVKPDPEVGMGVTYCHPQDQYPWVISRVSPSGKTIWVKRLKSVDTSTGHEPARFDGPFPVWEHVYSAEELVSLAIDSAQEVMVRKSKHGWWGDHGQWSVGQACYRRNYSY